MSKFKAVPEKSGSVYVFGADDYIDARHWVINHLDLSNNYSVVKLSKKEYRSMSEFSLVLHE